MARVVSNYFQNTREKDISEEEVDALPYDEKCKLLNLNPVLVAKHFQDRAETLLTEVLLSESKPVGKNLIVYFALHIDRISNERLSSSKYINMD